ncbi:hypothetical protein EJB05_24586, partial [Eragrostis curvula]
MASAAAGRALFRSVATRIAHAPQNHQRLASCGLHGSLLGPGRPYYRSSSTPPPINTARTHIRALQSGRNNVGNSSSDPGPDGPDLGLRALSMIFKGLSKLGFFALVYHIWGKPEVEAIKDSCKATAEECRIIRSLLEQNRDSEKLFLEAKGRACQCQCGRSTPVHKA